MNYGYFDNTNKEYVITNPKTPVKWINYIGGLSFGGILDHTGGALLCKGDPAINRITKYIPQLPASNFKGETLYIRMKKFDQYTIFSPYFVPTLDPYDFYRCHVGMGYSTYHSSFYGIETKVTVFVPLNSNRVIRNITIRNTTKEPVYLDVIPLVEYSHFEALKQFTNADWVPQTMMSNAIKDKQNHVILEQYAFMRKGSDVNYFTSNYPVSSFDTDRSIFLGDHEYHTFQSPLSLQQEELSNSIALRGDNIAALMHHLRPLNPGEEKRIITQLGQTENMELERNQIQYFRQEQNVDHAFEQLQQYWQTLLDKQVIETPDEAMNVMMNIFNPRQCNTTLNWSRYLSLYQLGLGARGIGFRDSSQDIMGVVLQSPNEAKQLLRKLLQVQCRNGRAMHQFNPISMIANEGDSREEEDRDNFYGDDHLWIVLAVCAYLKETGDLSFLEEDIPFYEKDKQEQPMESATVLEHLKRSLQFTKSHVGAHGLPLLGFADWNDTVNLPPGSESVFIANLYGVALQEMMMLMKHLNYHEIANTYQTDYANMKQIVNEVAWDGSWYVRYFDQDGRPVGSRHNDEGQLFANAQSWTILSGFAPEARAKQSLDSLYQHLNTPKGIKLSTPGYLQYDPEKGGVTTYPPGAKENGGIFLHSNPWVIIAETKVGNGNRAFQYYNQINPATKNDLIEEFECEPYVYPQNILGDEHPQFGLARNSWLSGTASWTYQAGSKYILGILPTYDGLQIDPCIPSSWDEFKVKRTFRDKVYHIHVKNPHHQSRGVFYMMVNNNKIIGNTIPVNLEGQEHFITAVIGAKLTT